MLVLLCIYFPFMVWQCRFLMEIATACVMRLVLISVERWRRPHNHIHFQLCAKAFKTTLASSDPLITQLSGESDPLLRVALRWRLWAKAVTSVALYYLKTDDERDFRKDALGSLFSTEDNTQTCHEVCFLFHPQYCDHPRAYTDCILKAQFTSSSHYQDLVTLYAWWHVVDSLRWRWRWPFCSDTTPSAPPLTEKA